MSRTTNGRRIYALADYTVERTSKDWYFGRTSRFGDMHALKGPYSSERSVALMSARELLKEIAKRDSNHNSPDNRGVPILKAYLEWYAFSARTALFRTLALARRKSPRMI